MNDAEAQDFAARLRGVMQIQGDEEVHAALLEAAAVLRGLEAKVRMATGLNNYERKKANTRLTKMASDLATVKHVKLPRKPFRFASRKYLDLQEAAEVREDHVVQFAAQHVIQGAKGESITVQRPRDSENPGEADAACIPGDFAIQHAVGCTITLPFGVQALYIDDCEDCTVTTGVVAGAVHVERCKGCTFSFVCHQLRIHHTHNTVFHLRAARSPIIEHTSGVVFKALSRAEYGARCGDAEAALAETGLGEAFETEQWSVIRDFSYLKPGRSPNYTLEGSE